MSFITPNSTRPCVHTHCILRQLLITWSQVYDHKGTSESRCLSEQLSAQYWRWRHHKNGLRISAWNGLVIYFVLVATRRFHVALHLDYPVTVSSCRSIAELSEKKRPNPNWIIRICVANLMTELRSRDVGSPNQRLRRSCEVFRMCHHVHPRLLYHTIYVRERKRRQLYVRSFARSRFQLVTPYGQQSTVV